MITRVTDTVGNQFTTGPAPNVSGPGTVKPDLAVRENTPQTDEQPGTPPAFSGNIDDLAGALLAKSEVQLRIRRRGNSNGDRKSEEMAKYLGAPKEKTDAETMPSPDGLRYYHGLPTNGGTIQGGGWSRAVRLWLERMEKRVGDHAAAREELRNSIADFDATELKARKDLEAAIAKDLPRGVAKLNHLTNGEVGRLAREYQEERALASQALGAREAAVNTASAALRRVDIAESDVQKHTLELEKKHLATRESELESDIAENEKTAGKAVDYAGKAIKLDFKGLAEDVAKDFAKVIVSDLLSSESKAALIQVKAKIDAIDEKLNGLESGQKRDALLAAKGELEASMKKIVLAEERFKQHSNQADSKLDQLVTHEKRFGRTTIFRELREYNTTMVKKGGELWRESGEYLKLMGDSDLREAGLMYERVAVDEEHVMTRSHASEDEKHEFKEVTDNIQLYAAKLEQWMNDRQPELKMLETARNNLRAGKHLDRVDRAMDQIINKALDGQDLSKDKEYLRR